MTTILMLHGARQRPHVWRAVSDNLPADWAVVAPQLHGRTDLEAMNRAIIDDLSQIHTERPIIIVAHEEGLIPAAEFCARNADTGDIAGLLVAEPRSRVTSFSVKQARIKAAILGKERKARGKRAAMTDSTREQKADFLAALQDVSARQNLLNLDKHGISVRILAGKKNPSGIREAHKLARLLPQADFFPIGMAEWDWNAYAPGNFAANIHEFIENIPHYDF